jgi:hypothetical protein
MSWLSEECAAELRTLGEADFVRAWTTLFGEPPATLIDRSEMVELIRAYLMPRGHGRPSVTATMPGSEPRKAA